MKIIGREKEIDLLQLLFESEKAEFLAVYGRRRVGKTFLISQFFHNKGLYFELTGRKGASKSTQLDNFETVYADLFNAGKREKSCKSWDEALDKLRRQIEKVKKEEKVILFFDELPWLASKKSGFLDALDLFWNRYISRVPNVILVICGSAAAWMINKVINNKGGLYNRLTRPSINLKPFTLKETEHYLYSLNVNVERKQLIDIYMAIGGVAQYLNLISSGKSSTEIIKQLFFSSHAPLSSEFHRLYESLFDKPQKYIEVIELLAKKQNGLTQKELFYPHTTLSPGGASVSILEELEHCGFILKIADFGKKKKEARYRLIDPFSLFYLRWVQGVEQVSEHYWMKKKDSPAYHSWAGYAFENICFLHYGDLIKSLELTVTAEAKSSWSYSPPKDSEESGAQIDLIIDRSDKSINLCEIKFYSDELSIDKEYASKLRYKKECFRKKSKTKKTLFTTLITTYGVKKNSHYFNSVDQQLTMDAFFES